MDDLISRAAAIKGLLSMCPEKTEPGSFDEYGVTVLCGAVDVVIKGLPAVDAAPVVHGRWEPSNDYNGYCRCSICHDTYIDPDWVVGGKWRYCPHCGAKMDGERRDDDADN